ncbi:hypothetical protein AC579_10350 [Pseudocercospora musae]|uniref:Uncharacterized protein n=1 Tax=Pseudocercospora musae TaxID=113226 RepID=A0A139ICV1_9PEZI|nr:hypothetical protein AC579_10350 [Pseudocercospora musae]
MLVAERPSAARPAQQSTKVVQIKDHNGDEVHIAWLKKAYEDADEEGLPPCPWQIYVLSTAEATLAAAQTHQFASEVGEWIDKMLGRAGEAEGVEGHYQLYTRGFNDYLACIAHQRREIAHRNRNRIWPHLIPSYAPDSSFEGYDPNYPAQGHEYAGFVLVLDRDDWQTGGVTALWFGRRQFATDRFGEGLPYGLENVVAAKPVRKREKLQQEMIEAWRQAEGHWMQANLTRRNQGALSPALYPAQDPSAHEDVALSDDDQHNVLDGEDSASQDNLSEMQVDQQDAMSSLHFDTSILFRGAKDFPYYKCDVYEDTIGWQVSSVWDIRHCKARPMFAFTLYLSAGSLPIVPQALFACLNQGQLSKVSWTLDVIHNLPDIGSAYRHYTVQARHRSVARSSSRAKAVRSILRRIALPFPEELLVHIHDILLPPCVVDYSSPPERRFRDVFMYLDAEAPTKGPHTVYSNPVVRAPFDYEHEEVLKFGVNHLQHWPLVADELHTLWSLCVPRAGLSTGEGHYFKMTLMIPSTGPYDETAIDAGLLTRPYIRMTLTLVGHRPVTIHRICHDFFEEALILDDPKTAPTGFLGEEWLSRHQRAQTWSTDPAFACPVDETGELPYHGLDRLETFMPGQEVEITDSLTLLGLYKWWYARRMQGLFEPGQRHHVRVSEELHIKRWTFGTTENLEGPFNLPPIPVRIEGQKEFVVDLQKATS